MDVQKSIKKASWKLTLIRTTRFLDGLLAAKSAERADCRICFGAITVRIDAQIDAQDDVERILKNETKMVQN